MRPAGSLLPGDWWVPAGLMDGGSVREAALVLRSRAADSVVGVRNIY